MIVFVSNERPALPEVDSGQLPRMLHRAADDAFLYVVQLRCGTMFTFSSAEFSARDWVILHDLNWVGEAEDRYPLSSIEVRLVDIKWVGVTES